MSRIVSVWLPRWPILRCLAAQAKHRSAKPIAPERPFVLVAAATGGLRIAALNAAAEAAGLARGDPVADGRAKAGFLQVRAADAAADDAALRRLALWATRYTPTASPWNEENGADGFFLDVEGAAHLFGGEEKLLADLASRLEEKFGLPARLAIASTPGAAWALARFHAGGLSILPPGEEAEALAPLPIEALRLTPSTCTTLRRLGFKIVGAVLDQPRAPFAARFPTEFLRRLDQALGRLDEPLLPVVAAPVYHTLHYLTEPIFTQDAVVARAGRLMGSLVHVLTRDDAGARALRLSLYGVDGTVQTVDIELTLPTRSVSHVTRLIALKLDALAGLQEVEFGFETVSLAVIRAEPLPARQMEFGSPSRSLLASGDGSEWQHDGRMERCATLIDALRQRLGPNSVRQFQPIASHLPERAEMPMPANGEIFSGEEKETSNSVWPEPEHTRPLLLLPQAEPAEVMALVPDGPPRRFCWRGVSHKVGCAQGPERVGAEWWRQMRLDSRLRSNERQEALTRDYYLVEDTGGHRYWLYREGLYERETTAARWFVHGLFA